MSSRLWPVFSFTWRCLLQTEVVHLKEAQLAHGFFVGHVFSALSKKDRQAQGQLGFLLGAVGLCISQVGLRATCTECLWRV